MCPETRFFSRNLPKKVEHKFTANGLTPYKFGGVLFFFHVLAVAANQYSLILAQSQFLHCAKGSGREEFWILSREIQLKQAFGTDLVAF